MEPDEARMVDLSEGSDRNSESSARAALKKARRIVVKIGTNTLMARSESNPSHGSSRKASGGIDVEYIHRTAGALSDLSREGREFLLVSSGAVGIGARELGMTRRPRDIKVRQACAAIGQPILMDEYRRAFDVYGIVIAQLLVTRDAWNRRDAYLNLRNTVDTLLQRRVLPIFNENDSVSTSEIAFGDNDQLSAFVASKIDADLLILLSDVDALYEANPRIHPEARKISYVGELDPDIFAAAGDRGTEFSTGGMRTKLEAVRIARDAGCRVVLAHGRTSGVIHCILSGQPVGTLFDSSGRLRNRERWIKHTRPAGSILVDNGALEALRQNRSLLPRGVIGVEGTFRRGDVVLVNGLAKAVVCLSSEDLLSVRGLRSDRMEDVLGEGSVRVVARSEDVVFLDR